MRTVELLERAVAAAERLGYEIRHEYLAGSGGGCCEFGGRKWLFIDLALSTEEQLDQVVQALRSEPRAVFADPSPELRRLIGRRAA
ncbi:MAG: hypothetical protein RIC55_28190 [Pirellulaceae bacterium]